MNVHPWVASSFYHTAYRGRSELLPVVVNSPYGLLRPSRDISVGGLGAVDGVSATALEDPLCLRPDAVLTLAVCAPVHRLDNGPPLEATIEAFGP